MITRGAAAFGFVAIAAAAGCDGGFSRLPVAQSPRPDTVDARTIMRHYGCGDCHTIPGVTGANGRVGPTLEDFRRRAIIGGSLPNTHDNLTRFIVAPPALRRGSAMPITGIGEPEARAVATYLLGHGP